MSAVYRVGDRVRVVVGGELFSGHVGVVERVLTLDPREPDYLVRFCGDWCENCGYPHHVEMHPAEELERA